MKFKMIVNNYIYSKVNNQLSRFVESDTKSDQHHHEIIFTVDTQKDVELIQKVTTYKGEVLH